MSINGIIFFFKILWNILYANSIDPDQTPHSAVSDLGLHQLKGQYKPMLVKSAYSSANGCKLLETNGRVLDQIPQSDLGLHCLSICPTKR